MKRILLLISTFLLVGFFSASAALIPFTDAKYDDFILKKDIWVCTSVSFPVDLAKDAFNTNYSTDIGTFMQVKPGDPTEVIDPKVSGVFNVTGRPAGIYEFVFTSKIDDFCGMGRGQQSVVRVYLVPELTGFSALTNLCAGGTVEVNLSEHLPYEIKNFAKDMGWSVDFFEPGVASSQYIDKAGKVTTSIKNLGVRTYGYKYNDQGAGTFQNKLSEMNSVYRCQDSALVMHNVKLHADTVVIPPKDITFCLSNLISVPQSSDSLVLNLKSLLGAEGKNGTWSSAWSTSEWVDHHIAKVSDATKGNATIYTKFLRDNPALMAPIKFKYVYEHCGTKAGKDSTYVLVHLTDNMKQERTIRDSTKSVCRNYGSGSLDLGPYFGFSVPNSAGLWTDITTKPELTLPTGSVNLDSLKVGSLYSFEYRVNPASDSICHVPGVQAVFHLRIRDAQTLSGVARMCSEQFKAGAVIDLYNYVQVSDTSAKKSEFTWTLQNEDGSVVDVTSKADKLNTIDLSLPDGLATGLLKFSYVFKPTSGDNCGPISGNLYLSVADSVSTSKEQVLQLCYTDDIASHINLYQVLGIAGLENAGKFTSTGTPAPKAGTFDDKKGIFNASASFDISNPNGYEEYVFTYAGNQSTSDCVKTDAKVRVRVTKTVKNTVETP